MKIDNILDKLEAKYSHLALEGLIRYVALLMLTVFILNKSGYLPYTMLRLEGGLILKGQIWRLITFLLIPISKNPFFLFFELMIIVMCADGIEACIGTFKLTLYYLLGAILMIIGALIDPTIQLNSYIMYLSLFFGYATLYPNQIMYFMFIIPLKIKYLAYFLGFIIIIIFIFAPLPSKIAILLAFTNYILFFGIPFLKGIKYEKAQTKRREEFEKAVTPQNEYHHKCSVCGKTDVSNPELLFKYCTCKKCGENGVAFCPEHLKEHKQSIEVN